MKGISAVIASILMLLIVMALAATTFYYVTNVLGGKIAKVVEVADATCTTGSSVAVVLRNDGTINITSSDLTYTVDGATQTCAFAAGSIAPTTSGSCTINVAAATTSGIHKLRVISSSNVVPFSYSCA